MFCLGLAKTKDRRLRTKVPQAAHIARAWVDEGMRAQSCPRADVARTSNNFLGVLPSVFGSGMARCREGSTLWRDKHIRHQAHITSSFCKKTVLQCSIHKSADCGSITEARVFQKLHGKKKRRFWTITRRLETLTRLFRQKRLYTTERYGHVA